eukprot:1142645-Pelagomonas_calceolata.AAC.2
MDPLGPGFDLAHLSVQFGWQGLDGGGGAGLGGLGVGEGEGEGEGEGDGVGEGEGLGDGEGSGPVCVVTGQVMEHPAVTRLHGQHSL